MDNVTEQQWEGIKKMSVSRLILKLINAGYGEKDVKSFDRPTCIEK